MQEMKRKRTTWQPQRDHDGRSGTGTCEIMDSCSGCRLERSSFSGSSFSTRRCDAGRGVLGAGDGLGMEHHFLGYRTRCGRSRSFRLPTRSRVLQNRGSRLPSRWGCALYQSSLLGSPTPGRTEDARQPQARGIRNRLSPPLPHPAVGNCGAMTTYVESSDASSMMVRKAPTSPDPAVTSTRMMPFSRRLVLVRARTTRLI